VSADGGTDWVMKAGIEAAGQLVKVSYDDALKPAAIEVGKALGTLGQAVNVALDPLRGLIWTYDQFRAFVVDRVGRELQYRGVPAEDIITPDADVAVPVIEALRYTKLRDNYAKLLATAMDSLSADQVHPAFPEMLKQITLDEARILEFLPRVGLDQPMVDLVRDIPDNGQFVIHRHVGTIGADAGCERPGLTAEYIDNLCRLGLLEVPPGVHLVDDWRYDRIRDLDLVKTTELLVVKKMVGVTSLGGAFREACIGKPARRERP
jgi:hypothetical protein